jgi:hypothetical protein
MILLRIFLPSYGATAQIGPWPPLFLRFLNHAQLDTRQDSSGRMISPSKRHLPTQDNTTYKHKRQISMPSAGFEPAITATKLPQTYALDRAVTGIGTTHISRPVSLIQFCHYYTCFEFMKLIIRNCVFGIITVHSIIFFDLYCLYKTEYYIS